MVQPWLCTLGLILLSPVGLQLLEAQAVGWEVVPQGCSMGARMEDAQRPCMGMEARESSSQQY